MNENRKIEWGKEIAQAGSDVAEIARDVGVPGLGLLARFAQTFYNSHLQRRFEKFLESAEVDLEMIERISANETYSNCFYLILESVRQTHSRIGLAALALIFKDHWNDEPYLIAAVRSFSQISDATIDAFLVLYDEIPDDRNYVFLTVRVEDDDCFHTLYNEAIELIARNFFVSSQGAMWMANGPVQGMKWDHTKSYYSYCKAAKEILANGFE